MSASARVSAHLDVRLTLPVSALDGRDPAMLIAEIEQAVNAVVYPSAEPVVLGWTASALRAALARLRDRGYAAQAAVIEAGLTRSDGKVSRETAQRLAERDDATSFRGFTKPVLRIVGAMRDAGEVAADAVDLLKATYAGAGTATGFEVRPELADLR